MSTPDSETPLLEKPVASSLDDTIERCIGSFGWAQLIQAVVVSFAWVFDAQQTFISVFTNREPAWHCINETCNKGFNRCGGGGMSNSSWAWDEPVWTSIVSEWNLECVGTIVAGLPTSSFFMGCLVGGLVLATLADSSLGRKNMLVLSCLIMSLATILTVFSPNIWVYSALRFIAGFGRASIGTCALVLATEVVGKKWRGEVGIIGFFCFTLGFLSLPAIAYISRASSWKTLYIWTSAPALFYSVLIHFMIHESPRWLFVQGRKEEAIKTLRSISNRSTSSSTNLSFIHLSDFSIEQETWNVDMYSAMKVLWEKRWAFQRLSAVMIVGTGIGVVYYGMPLNLDSLSFNLYLSVTLNALSELPASLIAFFLIGRLNRRSSMLVFTTLSGLCCVIIACLSITRVGFRGLEIGVELVSFFSACTAFNVLLIYSLELFPTCVRNSALSMVRQAIVLGGVLSPMLVAAGRRNKGVLSYGVFGLMIGCCGLFVACLPETKGGTFCDTMDEQEHKEIVGTCHSDDQVNC
ncbi:hypothetical protein GIB67_016084 [Kingdonia uniflora]|uniref:Major facilitator superfamily (MFS) profile domain-containing protein n=1 Tax=Kingdonia uniflora TaxID=39325 RepID=A0A7J7L230_9MAGN|nr:hypothetical protein GIB67_016084 [Kingdonia uniflora]